MKGLTPIILILLSIGTFFLFIDPLYNDVKELKKERQENDEILELAAQLQRKRDVLRDDFNSISEDDKKNLQKLLPDTVDNVRLILDINNIAETYGVVISNISVSAEEDGGQSNTDSGLQNVGSVELGFSINATYDIYLQLLRDLEEALRIVDINTLGISANKETEFYNFDITLETYWLR